MDVKERIKSLPKADRKRVKAYIGLLGEADVIAFDIDNFAKAAFVCEGAACGRDAMWIILVNSPAEGKLIFFSCDKCIGKRISQDK